MTHTIHYCYGNFCTTEELCIHPHDLGFLRGYGIFDYVPVYAGTPFRLQMYLDRLTQSAKQVGIEIPLAYFALEELTYRLLDQNPELNGGLRYVLTGGMYQTDTLYPESKPQLSVFTEPTSGNAFEPIRVVTSTLLRALPHVKTTNYLPAVLGTQKARKQGFQDALYVNCKGELLEGMTSNLFFIRKGKLYTDDSNQIVKGVTRSAVLEIAQGHLQVEMRPITLGELSQCEEAFLTSSTKDLTPIVQVDDHVIGSGMEGPWTRKLRNEFLALRTLELEQKKASGGGSRRLM